MPSIQIALPKQYASLLLKLGRAELSTLLGLAIDQASLDCLKLAPLQGTAICELDDASFELLGIMSKRFNKQRSQAAGYLLYAYMRGNKLAQEYAYQAQLHAELGGTREVPVPGGRIDLLTNSELIEVKHWAGYKSAIGQAMWYSVFKPGYKLCIALIGDPPAKMKPLIEQTCAKLGIAVRWL